MFYSYYVVILLDNFILFGNNKFCSAEIWWANSMDSIPVSRRKKAMICVLFPDSDRL